MKKKILIISGGISKERKISLNTGKQVGKELSKNNYNVKIIEPDSKLLDEVKKFRPNIIFNALHGQFGEDGYIQTILETTKIPYTHSGVISSAIAMDKELSKKIFIQNNILTPKFLAALKAVKLLEPLPKQNEIKGGSKETDTKELAVKPHNSSR